MGEVYITRRGGSGGGRIIPTFSYTGDYTILDDGDAGWRVKFLTSGVLTFDADTTIDVFCVGGGASGNCSKGSKYRGGGGGSGYTTTQTGIRIEAGTEYNIVIGAGGVSASSTQVGNSGGETSAFNVTAAGGRVATGTANDYLYGGNGGSGGAGGGSNSASGGVDGGDGQAPTYNGTGQGTTTREFGELEGTLYATGGASGVTTQNLVDADANTGDGGDGAYSSNVAGGAGGSGVVIIRNARGAA